jgi:hypothetical protein
VAVAGSGEASVARLSADVDALTERLDPYFTGVVPGAEAFPARERDALVGDLCDAAGVGVVAAAAGDAMRTPLGPLWRRARRPLVRPAPVQIHRAEQAIRRAGAALTHGLPEVWSVGVHRALAQGLRRLPEELDTALVEAAPAPLGRGAGARVAAAAQWVGVLAVAAGLLGGLTALTGAPVVRWWGVPGPVWVGLAGLAIVCGAAWFARRAAAAVSARRADAVAGALRARVRAAADRLLVAPAEAELDRYRRTHALFVTARDPMRGGWDMGSDRR